MWLSPPRAKRSSRSRHLRPCRLGLETQERDRLVAEGVVHVGRVVVGLRLADLADHRGVLVPMVHVEGQRQQVVEELRVHRPAAVSLPRDAPRSIGPMVLDELIERDEGSLGVDDETQTLEWPRQWAIVSADRETEPASVHAAAVGPKG